MEIMGSSKIKNSKGYSIKKVRGGQIALSRDVRKILVFVRGGEKLKKMSGVVSIKLSEGGKIVLKKSPRGVRNVQRGKNCHNKLSEGG